MAREVFEQSVSPERASSGLVMQSVQPAEYRSPAAASESDLPRSLQPLFARGNASSTLRRLQASSVSGTASASAYVLQLQRRYGNRYVQRVMAESGPAAHPQGEVDVEVENGIQRKRGAGQSLDHQTRSSMEAAFGADFGGVRVHTDVESDRLNRSVNAVAFTTGQDIFFSEGAYAPGTGSGKNLLAHELTHVVQQGGSGTVQTKLALGSPGDEFEQEAEFVAKKVSALPSQPVQRQCECGGSAEHSGECESCRKKREAQSGAAPIQRSHDSRISTKNSGQRMRLKQDTRPGLRRQARTCSASESGQENERTVKCGDSEYRVTMTSSSKPGKRDGDFQTEKTSPGGPETRTDVNAGMNGNSIYLTIDICRGGNEVRIKPSVDLPKAVEQALPNVLRGSGVLNGVKLTSGVGFTIVHGDSSTVTISPTVTVDEKGVSGGGVGVQVQTPGGTYSGQATYDERSHTGSVTFGVTPGKTQKTPECNAKDHTYLTLHCELIAHTPAIPATPEQKSTDTQVRYLFFPYASHKVRSDFRLPTDIQSLHDGGYQITGVDGFTSPEGPRERETKAFEGNIALGQERAQAALDWLKQESVCKACDLSGIQPAGHSELPPEQGKVSPEPKGKAMEHGAVNEFLGEGPGQTPDPLAPQTPEERDAFKRQSQSKQRDQVFELLRRAKITMQRTKVDKPADPGKPASVEASPVSCTPEVIDAARKSFGISF